MSSPSAACRANSRGVYFTRPLFSREFFMREGALVGFAGVGHSKQKGGASRKKK